MQRGLLRLVGRRRDLLSNPQTVGRSLGVVLGLDVQTGGSRLRIPATELQQIPATRVFHAVDEVVGRHRVAVMACEIEIGRLAKELWAEQGRLHPHQLGALVVDGRGVEIIDLDIGVGSHRVRHRTTVLGELMGLKQAHIGDALHAPRADVGRELLVPVDRKALLEAELEPIPAGDAVARPVVEVFVCDDALDALKIVVGCGVGPRQHKLVVEDVESLVFHGPHIEMADRHDHVDLEVVLATEAFLVPAHRPLQRLHRMVALIQIMRLDIDLQGDIATRCGREAVLDPAQVAGHQCEEITGLRKGILPRDQVSTIRQQALLDPVAVGQEHGKALAIGDQRRPKASHDIGAIQEVGDSPETLGLALGTEHPTGLVQPLQSRVEIRVNAHARVEPESIRHAFQDERVGLDAILGRQQRMTVDRHRVQIQLLAVEPQRAVAARRRRVAAHLQGRLHAGAIRVQLESEIDSIDQELGRAIVVAVDRVRRVAIHDDPDDGVDGWACPGGAPTLALFRFLRSRRRLFKVGLTSGSPDGEALSSSPNAP